MVVVVRGKNILIDWEGGVWRWRWGWETNLITSKLFSDMIQGVDDMQTEFFALLVFRDGNVFDVAYLAEIVDAKEGEKRKKLDWWGRGGRM